jgi:hypothetical protein
MMPAEAVMSAAMVPVAAAIMPVAAAMVPVARVVGVAVMAARRGPVVGEIGLVSVAGVVGKLSAGG